MRIFLAGGVSGNLKPMWKDTCSLMKEGESFKEAEEKSMQIFLAGGESRHWIQDELLEKKNSKCEYTLRDKMERTGLSKMRLYLAGVSPWRSGGCYDPIIHEYKPYILESFYYVDDDTVRLLPYFGDFLLDSGAFTFMTNKKSGVDWEDYIKRYSEFINANHIEKFFELDIDSVVGYKKVLYFREMLEGLTGKRSIPVWHKSRGIKEFQKMCEEYDYAAIGGIVSGEIKKDQYKAFPGMIQEAHRLNCKLHGLGFTNLQWLTKCRFDSVDSTAWTTGNRFGFAYWFNGKTMQKIDAPKGKRLADSRKIALMNYTEWLKFQKYAERNL